MCRNKIVSTKEFTAVETILVTRGHTRNQVKLPDKNGEKMAIIAIGTTWLTRPIPPEYFRGDVVMVKRDEADVETGTIEGIDYLIIRGPFGSFCGYVRLPKGLPDAESNERLYHEACLEEVTFARSRIIGFDQSHLGQHSPFFDASCDDSYTNIDQMFEKIEDIVLVQLPALVKRLET